mmetsp:Transcript_55833/g.161727  ORF Transcript_55833/g.161727 Transcript_55833/m.161727 type:complete len:191 (-) Transcript_55833:434-1006(-)
MLARLLPRVLSAAGVLAAGVTAALTAAHDDASQRSEHVDQGVVPLRRLAGAAASGISSRAPSKPEGVESDPRDDDAETALHSYWLAPGCSRMLPRHADNFPPIGFFEIGSKAVGKVQCCSKDTASTYCARAVKKACLNGRSQQELHTYEEASSICESQGFRLCSKAEIMTEDSAGCCGEARKTSVAWTAR